MQKYVNMIRGGRGEKEGNVKDLSGIDLYRLSLIDKVLSFE
jgi:hypothetical protein